MPIVDLQQKFETLKKYYFNKYTFLGVTGNGNYKRQQWVNWLFILISSLPLLFIFKVDSIAEVMCQVLLVLGCFSLSFLGIFFYTKYLDRRFKSKTVEGWDTDLTVFKAYLLKNIQLSGSFKIKNMIDYCNEQIENKKQVTILWFTFLVVIISATIGAFVSSIVTHVTAPNYQFNMNDSLAQAYVPYLFYALILLLFITYIQGMYITGRLGLRQAYKKLGITLEEIAEHYRVEELEINRRDLVNEIAIASSEKNGKLSFLDKVSAVIRLFRD
ncbi:MAG: hypothetical protein LBE37_14175 [Sphingobacterium sp.]|jgi:hypothetical protein|nr:hypothetical protein [Sphingobacterium sp.]